MSGVSISQVHHFTKFFFIVKERNIKRIRDTGYADGNTI